MEEINSTCNTCKNEETRRNATKTISVMLRPRTTGWYRRLRAMLAPTRFVETINAREKKGISSWQLRGCSHDSNAPWLCCVGPVGPNLQKVAAPFPLRVPLWHSFFPSMEEEIYEELEEKGLLPLFCEDVGRYYITHGHENERRQNVGDTRWPHILILWAGRHAWTRTAI